MYWPFEPERNVPVDCNSDESHTPGTFCVKVVKQGPRGFICKFNFGSIYKCAKYKIMICGRPDMIIIYICVWCIGDGRWRQVIRRCASVSDTGVTGVCNWGVYENGVYWQECYCASDGCNAAGQIR